MSNNDIFNLRAMVHEDGAPEQKPTKKHAKKHSDDDPEPEHKDTSSEVKESSSGSLSQEKWTDLKRGDHIKYKRKGQDTFKSGYVIFQWVGKDHIHYIKVVLNAFEVPKYNINKDDPNKGTSNVISWNLSYPSLEEIQLIKDSQPKEPKETKEVKHDSDDSDEEPKKEKEKDKEKEKEKEKGKKVSKKKEQDSDEEDSKQRKTRGRKKTKDDSDKPKRKTAKRTTVAELEQRFNDFEDKYHEPLGFAKHAEIESLSKKVDDCIRRVGILRNDMNRLVAVIKNFATKDTKKDKK